MGDRETGDGPGQRASAQEPSIFERQSHDFIPASEEELRTADDHHLDPGNARLPDRLERFGFNRDHPVVGSSQLQIANESDCDVLLKCLAHASASGGGLRDPSQFVTRAMKQLYLTYAESRRINGNVTMNRASRFISEMPEDVIKEVRLHHSVVRPRVAMSRIASEVVGTEFMLGQRVLHQKFGEGVILNYEGEGSSARVQVNFADEGSKWLVMGLANLKPVG